jgi:hypothetical protein
MGRIKEVEAQMNNFNIINIQGFVLFWRLYLFFQDHQSSFPSKLISLSFKENADIYNSGLRLR